MNRCCICMRSVEEDRVLMMKFPGTPHACHEHIREAVQRSDGVKPTEEEWQAMTRRLMFELEDIASQSAKR